MQERYYDPVIGRFYSNDPIGFRDVHSLNRYAYANNNPYKYTDLDGKSSLALCLTGPIGCGVGVGITIFAAIVTIDTAVRPGINIPAMLNESIDLVDDLKKGKDPVPGVEGERE